MALVVTYVDEATKAEYWLRADLLQGSRRVHVRDFSVGFNSGALPELLARLELSLSPSQRQEMFIAVTVPSDWDPKLGPHWRKSFTKMPLLWDV
jgi:hypothetical protein